MSQNTEQPIPYGMYLPAVRHADLSYTSGMTPRKSRILIYSGKIRANDPLESHRDAEPEFTAHPKIADYASETLIEHLGSGSIGSRAAIGVASLPSNAPVEVTLIGKVVSSLENIFPGRHKYKNSLTLSNDAAFIQANDLRPVPNSHITRAMQS